LGAVLKKEAGEKTKGAIAAQMPELAFSCLGGVAVAEKT
jgi:hypothetical protein